MNASWHAYECVMDIQTHHIAHPTESWHTYERAISHTQTVAPLLQNGDYVIVEDTNLDGHEHAVQPGWGPSPYDAIVNFMAMNRELYQRDLEREKKWGFSQSVNGFLIVKGAGKREIVNPLPENPYANL